MSGNQAIWLFTGAATLFLVGTDVFIMSPLLPAISAEFDVTPAAAGWLVTVMAGLGKAQELLQGSLRIKNAFQDA